MVLRKPQQAKPSTQTKTGKSTARSANANSAPSLADIQVSSAVVMVPWDRLNPARVNNKIYKPVDADDPAVSRLSAEIQAVGCILEPLIVTEDNVIVSGHRRHMASIDARVDPLPCRYINITSDDPRFERYLIACNEQRVKTADEIVRETVIRTSPEDAHNALLARRELERLEAFKRIDNAGLRVLEASRARRRAEISDAKRPLLEAAQGVLNQYRGYWPLTLRQIHYRLLTRSVRFHASKPDLYRNILGHYKGLSDLLTRARLEGEIPWESMHDPHRPLTEWRQWPNVTPYVQGQLDGLFATYKRNLLQSQPSYVELVVEKTAALDIAERAAGKFHVPVGVGRGYTSTTCLEETAERFRASGKSKFVLLIASDFDPEGEDICRTWGACLRDEHEIDDLTVVKVAVNDNHITEFGLSPIPMKESSSRAKGFEERHGKNVYELEALEPNELERIIREAIRGVIDLERFAEEQRQESEEARRLMALRATVLDHLKAVDLSV